MSRDSEDGCLILVLVLMALTAVAIYAVVMVR